MSTTSIRPPADLRAAHSELLAEKPRLRQRDAAAALGVPEAELVAQGCGVAAVRLDSDWPALFAGLEGVGRVMALTRNEHAVLEVQGTYEGVSFRGPMGLVHGADIDLRLFPERFGSAFAVGAPGRAGDRASIQLFDRQGLAVHKVHALPETDTEAWSHLVTERTERTERNPTPSAVCEPAAPARGEQPDSAVDVPGLRTAWAGLKDTHDFYGLLGRFRVTRTQALRLADPSFVQPVACAAVQRVLTSASQSTLPIMLFVGNTGAIQIRTGPVQRIVAADGWLNVLDPGFNLHLHEAGLANAWRVVKPTTDGPVSALEVYDAAGELLLQIFGRRKPGTPEDPAWTALAATLPEILPASAPARR